MKDHIISILIEDSLIYHGISMKKIDLSSLVNYAISESFSVLYLDDGNLYTDTTVKKDLKERLIISNRKLDTYFEKRDQMEFSKNIIDEYLDVVTASTLSGIPLSRLTNDYQSVHLLPSTYHSILESVYQELEPIVKYMKDNNLVEDYSDPQAGYFQIIREFITSELG